ncbi:Sieve element occlusion [Trema orientale]|uniref:Sieve element occlusion n=1 Tax=Trema orientale TaxID=63057 RepID=A0A2P5DXS6_TREOI|nr:Sieve element occlusion [Trema orientale]
MSQQQKEEQLSLFTTSDDKILDVIYTTHVPDDDSFDVDSMFVVVENIIKHSSQIVDNILEGTQVNTETMDKKPPKTSFSSPLCILKSICCELSCKPPGEEFAHKSTLGILNKLSKYSWDAKAVLTLAAFALDYGDFWLLAHLNRSDQLLSKSLAILRRVPVLLKPVDLQKHRQAVAELNSLIIATFQVIEIVFELEKLTGYDPIDVPALSQARHHTPVGVYWAIITIVACSTKINILTGADDKPHDLSTYAQKIHYILNKLKIHLIDCKKQIEEEEKYRKLRKLFQIPTEIMEIFKALIFTKDNVQPIIDGSTNTKVPIDVLRSKNLFLFISSLDITKDDISILKPIYDATKNDNQYYFVWIPIVEQWTEELKKKFENLRTEMSWYVVEYFSPIAGINYVKKEWYFKGKPIVVVMNPQGKVENLNALHLIRAWGMRAFPFNKTMEETISNDKNWIGLVVKDIDPIIQTWIKEGKYILFYGGKDNAWIQQFNEKATALVTDSIIKEAKISIELFCVGKTTKGEEDLGSIKLFWTSMESLFITKAHKQVDQETQEIQKLFSYKNESGWALLSKGSTVVFAGHGLTMIRVVEELKKWKENVKEKGFELAFKDHYSEVIKSFHHCSRLDIPSVAGKFPETMNCAECSRSMEVFICYQCCHTDAPANAHH